MTIKINYIPREDLQRLFEEEKEKFHKEVSEKAEAEERAHFFNQAFAKADFEHWSRAIYRILRGVDCIVIWEEP